MVYSCELLTSKEMEWGRPLLYMQGRSLTSKTYGDLIYKQSLCDKQITQIYFYAKNREPVSHIWIDLRLPFTSERIKISKLRFSQNINIHLMNF